MGHSTLKGRSTLRSDGSDKAASLKVDARVHCWLALLLHKRLPPTHSWVLCWQSSVGTAAAKLLWFRGGRVKHV